MRYILLKSDDYEMFQQNLDIIELEFYYRHKDAFRRMYDMQGKDFWVRFMLSFRSAQNFEALKLIHTHIKHLPDYLDSFFICVHEEFVDGPFSKAKQFFENIVTLLQDQGFFSILQVGSLAKNPFHRKETKDIYRQFFGSPTQKSSYAKVLLLLPLYRRLAGSLCICLRRWLDARDMNDPADTSYWVPSVSVPSKEHSEAPKGGKIEVIETFHWNNEPKSKSEQQGGACASDHGKQPKCSKADVQPSKSKCCCQAVESLLSKEMLEKLELINSIDDDRLKWYIQNFLQLQSKDAVKPGKNSKICKDTSLPRTKGRKSSPPSLTNGCSESHCGGKLEVERCLTEVVEPHCDDELSVDSLAIRVKCSNASAATTSKTTMNGNFEMGDGLKIDEKERSQSPVKSSVEETTTKGKRKNKNKKKGKTNKEIEVKTGSDVIKSISAEGVKSKDPGTLEELEIAQLKTSGAAKNLLASSGANGCVKTKETRIDLFCDDFVTREVNGSEYLGIAVEVTDVKMSEAMEKLQAGKSGAGGSARVESNVVSGSPERLAVKEGNRQDGKNLRSCVCCGQMEPAPKVFKKCKRCKDEGVEEPPFYCGRNCQVLDWNARHREEHEKSSS